jgi:hypothetical protein
MRMQGISDAGLRRLAQAVQQQQVGPQVIDHFEDAQSQLTYFDDGAVVVYLDGSFFSGGGPSGSAVVDMFMGVEVPGGWTVLGSDGSVMSGSLSTYTPAVNALASGTMPQNPDGSGPIEMRTSPNETDQFYMDAAAEVLAAQVNENYQEENQQYERPENVRF